MVGGLNAAGVHGLARWEREEITILVGNPMSFEPLPGYRFFRTRRPVKSLIAPGELSVCRLEPAVLLFAAHEPHLRTAYATSGSAGRVRGPRHVAPGGDRPGGPGAARDVIRLPRGRPSELSAQQYGDHYRERTRPESGQCATPYNRSPASPRPGTM